MRLAYLRSYPQFYPQVAGWIYEEFRYAFEESLQELIEKVEHEAREWGFTWIYLHTTDQEGFYARRDWTVNERIVVWDREVVLMSKGLDDREFARESLFV